MSYATKDAEMSSAREILFLCRGKLSADIRREASKDQPNAQRLADLKLVMSLLRNDLDAVEGGDETVTTRVRVMYGMLVRAWYAPMTQ